MTVSAATKQREQEKLMLTDAEKDSGHFYISMSLKSLEVVSYFPNSTFERECCS